MEISAQQFDQVTSRIADLIVANNQELERRRRAEQNANQSYAEVRLLRQECIRLRESLTILSEFIEEAHANSGERIPADIEAAMASHYPPDTAHRYGMALKAFAASTLEGVEFEDWVQAVCEDVLAGRDPECPECGQTLLAHDESCEFQKHMEAEKCPDRA